MTTSFNAPTSPFTSSPFGSTSQLRVSDVERERVAQFLQEAYADGRLDALEFDRRIDQALTASTRGELNASFQGLARVPLSSMAVATSPAVRRRSEEAPGPVSGLIHLSGLPTMFVGPLIGWAVTPKGTTVHREAAKALNFQLLSLVVFIVLGILDIELFAALWGVGWVVLTIVGAVKAFSGVDYTNPVMKRLPWRAADEHKHRELR